VNLFAPEGELQLKRVQCSISRVSAILKMSFTAVTGKKRPPQFDQDERTGKGMMSTIALKALFQAVLQGTGESPARERHSALGTMGRRLPARRARRRREVKKKPGVPERPWAARAKRRAHFFFSFVREPGGGVFFSVGHAGRLRAAAGEIDFNCFFFATRLSSFLEEALRDSINAEIVF